MRRCSVSIPSNIAEGHGRNSTGDYLRFLQIATGSLCELQTQLVIANNLSFFSEKEFDTLEENAWEIERMMSSFVRKLGS